MDIDAAVDRLVDRIRREGLRVPDPIDADEVASVEAEVAPLRLPAEYHRLLARMGPPLPLIGFPALHDLAFALECWRQQREFGLPRVLFTIAYTSHFWLAAELASPDSPGGELFCWSPGEDYAHLDGRLPGYLAALADAPAGAPVDGGGNLWVDADGGRWRRGARSAGRSTPGPPTGSRRTAWPPATSRPEAPPPPSPRCSPPATPAPCVSGSTCRSSASWAPRASRS